MIVCSALENHIPGVLFLTGAHCTQHQSYFECIYVIYPMVYGHEDEKKTMDS
jgi:hypothetical protein